MTNRSIRLLALSIISFTILLAIAVAAFVGWYSYDRFIGPGPYYEMMPARTTSSITEQQSYEGQSRTFLIFLVLFPLALTGLAILVSLFVLVFAPVIIGTYDDIVQKLTKRFGS
jgi:hypothetical protein